MSTSVQVLVSTMNQTDYSLLKKMNIQTDAIIINQCNEYCFNEFEYNGNIIKWISLPERGVGLSRNTALMRSTADIVMFADDDVVYENDFEKSVVLEYERNPKIDIITFNLCSLNENRPEFIDKKEHRLRWFNCLRYGAFRISARRESIFKNNLFFSQLYGGGAPHQAGEDNLFLTQALQRGMKLIASSKLIGTVAQSESSWFRGYNEEYYYDRGFLFANMYGCFAKPLLFALELKEKHKKTELHLSYRVKEEKKGISDFRSKGK